MRTIIDVHILQSVPPSNINRDDTGSPKTAIYGGTRRARVSSQAWKRATRKTFESLLDMNELGVRTKRLVEALANRINELDASIPAEEREAMATSIFELAGFKLDKPRVSKAKEAAGDSSEAAQSQYLFFLGNHQLDRLAELALANRGGKVDKKDVKAAADQQHSIDVALFGRMVADDAELNVDASAQVAHAISVHAVDTEFDYFTAVDDLAPESQTGAGMIGTVEFNSSTLYRYATVDIDALFKTLGDATATSRGVAAFIRAFVTSMPTGKQNTFANRTLPDAVVVQVRDGQSINLAGAFEDAVSASLGSPRLNEAASRLTEHARAIDRAYDVAPVAGFVVRAGSSLEPLDQLGENVTLSELISQVSELVTTRTGGSV